VRRVVLGMGERSIYRGKEEVNLLLGDRRSRGEHSGEICGVGVVQQLGNCSPQFCPQTVRSSGDRTRRSGAQAGKRSCQGGSTRLKKAYGTEEKSREIKSSPESEEVAGGSGRSASLFSSSPAAEGEEKRSQAREEIGRLL
jgi:hypothetical protein